VWLEVAVEWLRLAEAAETRKKSIRAAEQKKLFGIFGEGATRYPVIVVGPVAFQWAKSDRGRECNLFEAIYIDVQGRADADFYAQLFGSRRADSF
jgi:hypothetical protein